MDTYPSNSASQSNEATHSSAKWSLSERLMSNPTFSVAQTDVRKSRKHIIDYYTKEPLSNFEFDGGEIFIKTAEAKT